MECLLLWIRMGGALANVLHQEVVHIRVWEEDGGFIAECSDIPGCMSQGDTRNAALANLMDAISMCLEVIAEDAGYRHINPQPEYIELPIQSVINATL